jgi:hypothetical protein
MDDLGLEDWKGGRLDDCDWRLAAHMLAEFLRWNLRFNEVGFGEIQSERF